MRYGLTLTFLVFGVFNLPVAAFLVAVPFSQRLDEALQEKDATGQNLEVTSYARVTAALGSIILTAFFWALGNILLAEAMSEGAATIGALLRGIWPFFLAGAAFFLPYAFNQLKNVFPWQVDASTQRLAMGTPPAAQPADGIETMQITVANLSTKVTASQLNHALQAIAIQVASQFAPEWKRSASLVASTATLTGNKAPVDGTVDAVIYLGDRTDDPNNGAQQAKGYHDRNLGEVPYGFVYLDVCEEYGEPWSVTLSHEVLELLADPSAVMTVQDNRPGPNRGAYYSMEVCDPTQGDIYHVGDVAVCNFVTRAFFGAAGQGAPRNHLGLPQQPFTPRPRGYVQFSDALGPHLLWGEDVTDRQKAAKLMLGPYRRSARRAARHAEVPRAPADDTPTPKRAGRAGQARANRRRTGGKR